MPTNVMETLRRFNHLQSETDRLYHQAARRLGLSDSAMHILYTICYEGDPCPLNDICRLSFISKQTINSAIRRLEAEGILYLEAYAGRKKLVHLTQKGKKLAAETAARIIEIENQIFDAWPEADRALYLQFSQNYLTAFAEKIRAL